MHSIKLNKEKNTIVDKNDFKTFGRLSWFFSDGGYAKRSVKKNGINIGISMHREIMDAPKGMKVDHINGNRLDNRKTNLRLCNNQQNVHNSKVNRVNKSGFKGVSWMKSRNKWRARIKIDMKEKHLGLFPSREEAARSYNESAKKYFGEFAYLNKNI